MANSNIWSSIPVYVEPHICVDVHVDPDGVRLGQVHGARSVYAADLHLSPADAEAIGQALIEGARRHREAQS